MIIILKMTKIILIGFLSACASFHGQSGQGVTEYKPAAIGPQMDIQAIRYDAMNRAN